MSGAVDFAGTPDLKNVSTINGAPPGGGPPQSYSDDLAGADVTISDVTSTLLSIAVPALAGRTHLRLDFCYSGQMGVGAAATVRFRVRLDGVYQTGCAEAASSGFVASGACSLTVPASAAAHTVDVRADTDSAAVVFWIFASGAATPGGVASPAYPMQATLTVTEAKL